MDAVQFFRLYQVFSAEEFGAALGLEGRTRDARLVHHRRQGRIIPLRRGLYWVVAEGETVATCRVDLLVVAGLMVDDAVLAYQTALDFHFATRSGPNEIQYLSDRAVRNTTFRDWRFRRVAFPRSLVRAQRPFEAVDWIERGDEVVRITTRERTVVDVLDRPDLGAGWPQLVHSLDCVTDVDIDLMVDYALTLGNATTIAKVGWFLERRRAELAVETHHLDALRASRPAQPHYLERRQRGERGSGRMVPAWNLVVPRALAD